LQSGCLEGRPLLVPLIGAAKIVGITLHVFLGEGK
jgi:hypothetical protein